MPCTPSANSSSKAGSSGRTIGAFAAKMGSPPKTAGLSLMPPLLSDFDYTRGDPYSSHVGGEVVYDCSPSADDCPWANRSSLHDIRPHADVTAFPDADIAGQMDTRINVTISSNFSTMTKGYTY